MVDDNALAELRELIAGNRAKLGRFEKSIGSVLAALAATDESLTATSAQAAINAIAGRLSLLGGDRAASATADGLEIEADLRIIYNEMIKAGEEQGWDLTDPLAKPSKPDAESDK